MFKDVPGYEGLYQVDENGNIFSIRSNKYLAPVPMKNGYLYAHLNNGKNGSCLKRIHRIVAEVFLNNPKNYSQVNHINGNKRDNRVCNLEWCTQEQNMRHAIEQHLFNTSGENNPSAKLNRLQVDLIRKEYVFGSKEHGTRALGKKYGVTDVMIGKIVRGECWKEGDL